MDDLYQALGDIRSIRKQVASTTEFRGYGPATLVATGVLALLAALVQERWVPDPAHHVEAYLSIWILTAFVSAALAGAQMYTRSRRIHSALSDEMIRMAVEQFVPSLVAGVLLSAVLLHFAPLSAWLLPGIWQVLFSLGVFSSCRFLPKPMILAGAWYLLTGLNSVATGGFEALSPWMMGIPFGLGQLLVAAILLRSAREVTDEE